MSGILPEATGLEARFEQELAADVPGWKQDSRADRDVPTRNDADVARLTSSAPVFLVRDVVAAANHYRDAMGFAYEMFYGEPPAFVILHRDGMYLMLRQAENAAHVVPHWTVSDKLWQAYFWVDDADALHAEFVGRGAKIDYGPCDQPYGCREFGIQDLDGYDVGFGEILKGH